jgi:hypothetical protein
MTAAGELLNLPVTIPMRTPVSAYPLPQRRSRARHLPPQPQRVYALPRRRRAETWRYDADGYTRTTPEKGNIIDLFA